MVYFLPLLDDVGGCYPGKIRPIGASYIGAPREILLLQYVDNLEKNIIFGFIIYESGGENHVWNDIGP